MELKTPTPLGEDEGHKKKKKKEKKSITDRILDIAKEKKEARQITFPDIYLPKRKSVVQKTNEKIKLKAPTPLGEDDSKDKKESDKNDGEIPEIFRPKKDDKEKYKREKVKESISLKTPSPLGEKVSLPSINIKKSDFLKLFKKVSTVPFLKKNNPLSLLKKIKIPDLTKEQKKKIGYISIFVVPLLVFISLLLAILIYTRAEPFNIAEDFLQKIEQRDVEGAYQLTTQAYQAITTKKEFGELVVKLSSVDIANAKRKRKRIDNEGVMGTYAFIRYQVSGYYVDITMFNDDSNWGVHTVELRKVD